ncbi:MAG: hypothetical protein FWE91_06760 [Defluviitaleaceae bacterium]|nr:hypothetical protein [Defluviitaleaceae bacterium]MCL2836637.1 hypothetical protein [Defluviitaleaceae bacterium]
MMQLVVALLVAGIILLIVETFFPGFGVFGILGIVALVAAAVLLIIFVPYGIYFALLELVLVAGGIFTFVKLASKRGILKKLIMDEALSEDSGGMVDLSKYEGKTGVAVTPMRPIGTVDFGGVSVEAYSTGAYINSGDRVIVTGSQENKLFVRLMADNGAPGQPSRN